MSQLALLIKKQIKEQGLSGPRFARKLGMSRSGFYRLINRTDMPLSRFVQICRELNHNFFHDLYPTLTPQSNKDESLRIENEQLKHQIASLTADKKLLSDVINFMKDK